ncbi:hypothetical protein HGI32_16465 [Clostridium acetobutylicum]|uniref:Uncharacterized protein, homolog of YYBI B.subtilis fused to uncharacterized domain similar to A.thaliana (Gi:3292817 and 5002526) n=1 Tax=Clostridium acetobutylicum (strain ATCC 824 / DSM 792 / JCM 1419 / IAM 19013 / LMG 5710 / NBRC 13948 / NRRL B-527 / VKM B-1787 / 2291 / W) TaxID=272562 RepID=Q97DQ6_CLOAB|nr:Uncharacterized protein, homolog of YYBI B.subtilis fused to uncharacterized domain similar to A.thaliana (gi:3292817 and 5002526) [Clostridium acetobutylicum ATCC 824]AEI32833.1 hypothetical protein SMB_G3453 [Clostridium acetobutylicum DSM 1731]AWV80987.1 hypothetical protein DK921_12925 [Clostridium acetobutylicum]PSM05574.1 hypothetical protein C7T89_12925 [Clostridium sp. NJ4]MBC2395500.1 hypothetical protein [Clostridium acetobutylicum]
MLFIIKYYEPKNLYEHILFILKHLCRSKSMILNPQKLSVDFGNGITATEPIIPRRYTLTHSDITAKLFLNIGLTYAYNKMTTMRDEVLGEWVKKSQDYSYQVFLHVDGRLGPKTTAIRNKIFRRELPLALEAIRYGDKRFFNAHPYLDNAPITVFFISTNPNFNKIENWGTFSDYNIESYYRNYKNVYLLDRKVGDVTGDDIPDTVSLYGEKEAPSEIFADDITVIITDGSTGNTTTITPEFNSGYNPTIFLGDFTKNRVYDIKISIDSGGSGGYGFFYIYSFMENTFREIFNFDAYNKEYKYKVDYDDLYKVNVGAITLNKLFILDISYKGYDVLSQYYYENGKLIKPVDGDVLALGALVPIVSNELLDFYNLLAFQRIIGTYNADTLGYVQNLLSWDGKNFTPSSTFVNISGSSLISPY